MNNKFVLLIMLFLLLTPSCASIVDKDKISGLQDIALWKSRSERTVKVAPATCETVYAGARDQLNAYLDTILRTEIGHIQNEFSSQIDLSREKIPAEVAKSVNAFLECDQRRVYTSKDVEVDIAILQSLAQWADREESARRKASATALKDELTKLTWLEWKDIRK